MCTEGRSVESRSVCLTEPNPNYPKKFPRNFALTNLKCKPLE